ncbi:DUF3231 family protein [Oceanobacillus profundus]|uniref:DUF3231 family protein n=1 Tax=Oceanobacillus profundus TaxID=372463 RepID=A0A417YDW0_9BACI|nr:DUF3231 family protein [Oceanobacillus profundus]RHW30803.1 DUF3231 family protein [Oceanobacillus profundus]
MGNHDNIKLTAPEISTLWAGYQSNSMAICGLKYFLMHVDNEDIRSIIENALTLSEQQLEKTTDFFRKEGYPVPQGFTEKDVNLNAPRLFSDKLYLAFVFNMTVVNLASHVASLTTAVRSDLLQFYADCLSDSEELHMKTKEFSKEIGIHIRAPHIPTPSQIDFVKKESFTAGWLTDRRPLLGSEITNLVFNARRNSLGQAVITGFSQVAQSKDVRKYFERGREISKKHIEVFNSILSNSYLSDGTILLTPEVTESTDPPFSDKFMMVLTSSLIASGIGQYGMSLSLSPRHDIAVQYSRLMVEIANYANDGASIMIENGWMEQPPMAADRKGLAK